MIEGDWWRTAIAAWGAGLSTLLAALKWLEASPIVYMEPLPGTERGVAALVVRNPYRKPLQIFGLRIVKPASVGISLSPLGYEDLRGALKYAWNEGEGIFNLYIPPDSEAKFRVILVTDHEVPNKGWAIIGLRWHRHDLLPRIPKTIIITKPRLEQNPINLAHSLSP